MAIAFPWHSTRLGESVYHNNTECTEGNNIERRYYAIGEGGKTLCTHCARLNAGVNHLAGSLRDLLRGGYKR